MSSLNKFDGISKIYDALSTLVFGKDMFYAQTIFLKEITPDATVLILGGGTGWLLAELLKTNSTCKVWYIDASLKMIALSKEKVTRPEQNRVYFIHGTEDSIPRTMNFDVVITPFYLDLFNKNRCDNVVQKIKSSLHSKSIWLVMDFINNTWWHQFMLVVMYNFFKIASKIGTSELPQWEDILKEHKLLTTKSCLFFGGFIKSSVVSFTNEDVPKN